MPFSNSSRSKRLGGRPDGFIQGMRALVRRSFSIFNLASFQRWLVLGLVSLGISFVISPNLDLTSRSYKVGDVVTRGVKAPQDLVVEDWTANENERLRAEERVLPVFDLDSKGFSQAEERLSRAFSAARDAVVRRADGMEPFQRELGTELPPGALGVLRQRRFSSSLEKAALALARSAMEAGVAGDRFTMLPARKSGAVIRLMPEATPLQQERVNSVLTMEEVRRFLVSRAQSDFPDLDSASRKAVVGAAEAATRPNVTFNEPETEARRQEARRAVGPLRYQVKRGEMILREGERVRQEDLPKLAALQAAFQRRGRLWTNLGFAGLVFVLLAATYIFATRNIRKFAHRVKDHIFLGLCLFGGLLIVKVSVFISDALGNSFPTIPGSAYYYAIPFAAGAMLVRFIINSETAAIFSVVVSILVGLIFRDSLFFSIYCFVGSTVAAHMVGHCQERSSIIKTGFVVGAVNLLVAVLFAAVGGRGLTVDAIFNAFFAFMGGLIAGVVVSGLTPIVEALFNYTSNIKLLELANMEQPLLKQLMIQAPGTYHHSVVIGNLAEGAARAVDANPLLARVSSFYHDIGKSLKPAYFVENLSGEENRHDSLTPRMSSLILVSHVKDGIELARRHKLGGRIMDIIGQHHGTSLIKYFYHKAKQVEASGSGSVDEEDYRYPGPKPQTKEAGLVMLADAVEAASRTLDEPTPARIEGLVQKIVHQIFMDGQLEECELTLKDLHQIQKSFVHTLTGIFHHRIKYPERVVETRPKRVAHGGANPKSAEGDPGELKKDEAGRSPHIRKVGPA